MGAERDRRTLHFGVFELHPSSGELRKHGVRLRLQDQPFKLLLCLLETPGEIWAREDLIRRFDPIGHASELELEWKKVLSQTEKDAAEKQLQIKVVGPRTIEAGGRNREGPQRGSESPCQIDPAERRGGAVRLEPRHQQIRRRNHEAQTEP